MIDVGLIGFGLAGRAFHAPVIRAVPGLRLAAILQRSGTQATEQYSDVRIVRSVEELLSIESIRLIVIATPNDTHHPFARQCLAAGRDVVVDKPFTTTLAEAAELVQFAKQCGRLLTVYQNRRFDGDFQAIRQIVAGGALGRVVRFETNYDRFRPQIRPSAWREKSGPGTGILFDLGPHLIDHALVLFGLPEAITADVRMERDNAVTDDAFDILLHYPHSLRAVLRSTMLAASPRPRFVLHGTRGGFFKQSFDPQENNLRRGEIPKDAPWGAEPEEDWGVLTVYEGEIPTQRRIPSGTGDYRDYYANVRDAILGKATLHVAPQHALDVMRILELARESSRRRCTIPWADAAFR
ncbi:MAG: oxidoreductase [Candidatus Acidiferrales bacterium]